MDRGEFYLKRAQYCRDKANADADSDSAARWLKIATNYEDMARNFVIFKKLLGSHVAVE